MRESKKLTELILSPASAPDQHPAPFSVGSYEEIHVQLLSVGQNKGLHQISNSARFRLFLTLDAHAHRRNHNFTMEKRRATPSDPFESRPFKMKPSTQPSTNYCNALTGLFCLPTECSNNTIRVTQQISPCLITRKWKREDSKKVEDRQPEP